MEGDMMDGEDYGGCDGCPENIREDDGKNVGCDAQDGWVPRIMCNCFLRAETKSVDNGEES